MTIEFGPYFWTPVTTVFCDCCNGGAAMGHNVELLLGLLLGCS